MLDLYEIYPDLESELRKVELLVSKSHNFIEEMAKSDLDYSNFFIRKSVLRSLRKVRILINDSIDYLSRISHPVGHDSYLNDYFHDWDWHDFKFFKKKFLPRNIWDQSIEYYDFDTLTDSLKRARHKLRDARSEVKKINHKGFIKSFIDSIYHKSDISY